MDPSSPFMQMLPLSLGLAGVWFGMWAHRRAMAQAQRSHDELVSFLQEEHERLRHENARLREELHRAIAERESHVDR